MLDLQTAIRNSIINSRTLIHISIPRDEGIGLSKKIGFGIRREDKFKHEFVFSRINSLEGECRYSKFSKH